MLDELDDMHSQYPDIISVRSDVKDEGYTSTPHIHQTYDLNENGRKETLLLNAHGISAVWVEILSEGNLDTLWSYSSAHHHFE